MNGVANGLYGGDLLNQINTPWIDFSEQSTIVGWSAYTTKRIRYKVVGNIVYVNLTLDGTSNSTSTTFTLPYIPKITSQGIATLTSDNGASTITGRFLLTASDITVICSRPSSASSVTPTQTWTASGNKIIIGQFFYEI
jgi:hypothetical protein